jgi:hypothetical protein
MVGIAAALVIVLVVVAASRLGLWIAQNILTNE